MQLEADKKVLYADLNLLNNQHQTFFKTLLIQRSTAAESLILENAAIITTEIYEINEQMVNDLYLHSLKLDFVEFTPEQLKEWGNIAWQCPNEGGYAVYRARAFISALTDELTFNENCEGIGFRNKETIKDEETTIGFNLYPNPANDFVNLNVQSNENQNIQVKITNIMGQEVYANTQQNLNNGENIVPLNIQNLSTGIYFVTLRKGNQIATQKLVVR